MTDNSKPRVRFAPSPTGYLHIGGLRTALYNFLFARKTGGTFILRIEDTDRTRLVEGATENLIRTLNWAGLDYDEGPGKKNPTSESYVQSERLHLYKKYCDELIAKKLAYPCFSTSEELEEVRKLQQKQGIAPKYNRKWLPTDMGGTMPVADVQKKLAAGEPHVIRMRVPDKRTISFHDVVRGTVSFETDTIDDQVLMKSDGFPTYHLANVIDDHLMNITHVIRGEEWLPSTPKHILLYEFFGWQTPQFAHLPLLLNPDRSKLSKRQGDVSVEDFRDKGYSKEAIINFIALLGWNAGDGEVKELYTMDELIQAFSLERVGKSGAVFNREKLDWLNTEYLRRTPNNQLASQLKAELLTMLATKPTTMDVSVVTSDAYLLGVVEQMKDRVNFVHDFLSFSGYFFYEPEGYDMEAVRKRWQPNTNELLTRFIVVMETLPDFKSGTIEVALKSFAETNGFKPATLIHPIRLAVSGMGLGPSLFHLMEILGRDICIRRIQTAMMHINPASQPA